MKKLSVLWSLGMIGLGIGATAVGASNSAQAFGRSVPSTVELVQSVPEGLGLEHPKLKPAARSWVELIRAARGEILIGQMYLSFKDGEATDAVVKAIEDAAARGVRVRLLLSKNMLKTDVAALERMKNVPGIEIRSMDFSNLGGGILHAKYWVFDSDQIFIGSQNFDWKALSQIHETGVRIQDPDLALQLRSVFEKDWFISEVVFGSSGPLLPATKLRLRGKSKDQSLSRKIPWIELVGSPKDLNPVGMRTGIDALVKLLGEAKKTVTVQLLNYAASDHSGTKPWLVIDQALRAAAGRGVKVKLLMSHWNTEKPGIDDLKSLSKVPGIEVKLSFIPEHPQGFISYARVIHSKLMVIDDQKLWVGTSNWGRGYFESSRNLEVILDHPTLAHQGAEIFDRLWSQPYSELIDPNKDYPKPRKDK